MCTVSVHLHATCAFCVCMHARGVCMRVHGECACICMCARMHMHDVCARVLGVCMHVHGVCVHVHSECVHGHGVCASTSALCMCTLSVHACARCVCACIVYVHAHVHDACVLAHARCTRAVCARTWHAGGVHKHRVHVCARTVHVSVCLCMPSPAVHTCGCVCKVCAHVHGVCACVWLLAAQQGLQQNRGGRGRTAQLGGAQRLLVGGTVGVPPQGGARGGLT